MKKDVSIILSCEHAGNQVPPEYKKLFSANRNILKTHRGYDIGIATIAERISRKLSCPLCEYTWTRLLIEPNRTRRGSLFSEFSKTLDAAKRQHLFDAYYLPYRNQLEKLVRQHCRVGTTLHLSLHSFTPVLNDHPRNADIGILYDPSRKQEQQFALAFQKQLQEHSEFRVRRNYPYCGRADGMTTWLRKKNAPAKYMGIEIEINQAILTTQATDQNKLITLLAIGVQNSLALSV